MHAMIFCAGLGTRLKPFTETHPKALLPLAGKTLLQWQVEKLRDAGIKDIIVNVHHFPDQIIDTIRANDGWGCNISVSDERDLLLDTGGGLRKAKSSIFNLQSSISDPILACNVDILSNIDIRAFVNEYNRQSIVHRQSSNRQFGMLVVSERETQRYLLFDDDLSLRGWTNIATGELKPASLTTNPLTTNPLTPLAFSGMQILSPEILCLLEQMPETKFSLIDFYLRFLPPLKAYIPKDYKMMDVGKIEQLNDAERFAEQIKCSKCEKK